MAPRRYVRQTQEDEDEDEEEEDSRRGGTLTMKRHRPSIALIEDDKSRWSIKDIILLSIELCAKLLSRVAEYACVHPKKFAIIIAFLSFAVIHAHTAKVVVAKVGNDIILAVAKSIVKANEVENRRNKRIDSE